MGRVAVGLALALAPGGCRAEPEASVTVRQPDSPLEPRIDRSGGGHDGPLVEPHVAVHPSAGANVVVGVIAPSLDREGPWHCAALTTLDGGASWSRRDFSDMERCIDPWAVFTGPDSVLLMALEIRRDSVDEGRFRLVAYRSADRGLSWAGPDTLGRGFEHPILAAAPGPEPAGSAGVLLLARRMSRGPGGALRHRVWLGRPAAAGRSLVPLYEGRPAGTGPDTTEITPTGLGILAADPVGGAGAGAETLVVSVTGGGRAWALRSTDGGHGFTRGYPITDACAGGGLEDEFAGWPFLAADRARGRLYHACVRRGFAGVEVRYSADGGLTWSAPALLGTEAGLGAARFAHGPPHARTPMLAVNGEGAVGAAWYDRALDPDRSCQDVWFAASTDGGVTFGSPVRITRETSCPRGGGNGWVAESWPSGGDYSSLAAAPDGSFRLVWADSRSGRFRLRTAVLEVRGPE